MVLYGFQVNFQATAVHDICTQQHVTMPQTLHRLHSPIIRIACGSTYAFAFAVQTSVPVRLVPDSPSVWGPGVPSGRTAGFDRQIPVPLVPRAVNQPSAFTELLHGADLSFTTQPIATECWIKFVHAC